jgi:hypothetical protein
LWQPVTLLGALFGLLHGFIMRPSSTAHLVWDSEPVTIIMIIINGKQLLAHGVCMIVTSEVTHDHDHVRRHKPLTILVQHHISQASMPQLSTNRQCHHASPQLFAKHYHMCFDEWLAS